MSKSTPITQLPTSASGGAGVSDMAQHMMYTQQAGLPPTAPPQNSGDMMSEDDATIQEVLGQIEDPTPGVMMAPLPPSVSAQRANPVRIVARAPPPPPQSSTSVQVQYPQHLPMQAQPQYADAPPPQSQHAATKQGGWLTAALQNYGDDAQLASVVAAAFVATRFVPVERVIAKYFAALERIPHVDVWIKAAVVAVLAVLLRRALISA
jgi:hypothetical protein